MAKYSHSNILAKNAVVVKSISANFVTNTALFIFYCTFLGILYNQLLLSSELTSAASSPAFSAA